MILAKENSIWRFVGENITNINQPKGTQALQAAMRVGQETEIHLKNAERFYAQKEYRKSGEEVILAVEAYGREIADEKSMILSDLCKKRKLPLPESLLKSLELIYAYSSDELRHAIKKGSAPVTKEHAQFMITICSGFINFLKAQHEKPPQVIN